MVSVYDPNLPLMETVTSKQRFDETNMATRKAHEGGTFGPTAVCRVRQTSVMICRHKAEWKLKTQVFTQGNRLAQGSLGIGSEDTMCISTI